MIEYMPTPEQIRAACAEIQAGWSEDQRISRTAHTCRSNSMSRFIPDRATQVVPREIWTEFVGQDRQGEEKE